MSRPTTTKLTDPRYGDVYVFTTEGDGILALWADREVDETLHVLVADAYTGLEDHSLLAEHLHEVPEVLRPRLRDCVWVAVRPMLGSHSEAVLSAAQALVAPVTLESTTLSRALAAVDVRLERARADAGTAGDRRDWDASTAAEARLAELAALREELRRLD